MRAYLHTYPLAHSSIRRREARPKRMSRFLKFAQDPSASLCPSYEEEHLVHERRSLLRSIGV